MKNTKEAPDEQPEETSDRVGASQEKEEEISEKAKLAVAYGDFGIPVFPCNPKSGEPCGKYKAKTATTERLKILAAWKENPDAQIAMPFGTHGIVALKIKDGTGAESLRALEAKNGELQKTQTVRDGKHLLVLFRCEPGFVLSGTNPIAPGLSHVGGGKPLFLPSTLEPDGSGREWQAGTGIGDVKIADFPPWLLALVRHKAERHDLPRISEFVPGAPVSTEIVSPAGWIVGLNGVTKGTSKKRILLNPLLVSKRLVNSLDGAAAVRISWPEQGQWHRLIVPRSFIASQQSILGLANHGISVHAANARDVAQYLSDFEAINRFELPQARFSSALGWMGENGEEGFLCGRNLIGPDGELISPTDPQGVSFSGLDPGTEQIADGFVSRGTFESWKRGIAGARYYPPAAFAIYASLASPMLFILDAHGLIIHFCGPTSVGKTTVIRLGGSCWGCVDERSRASTLSTWGNKPVFIERLAGVLRNLPLLLDDTNVAKDSSVFSQIVYMVAGGMGLGRGTVEGMQSTPSWNLIMLSTGESRLSAFTKQGGVLARIIEPWGSPFGKADRATATIVNELNRAVKANNGFAGPAFVQFLLRKREKWPEWRNGYQDEAAKYQDLAGDDPVAGRIAAGFAVIAFTARLVHEAGILPWEYDGGLLKEIWKTIQSEHGMKNQAAQALREVMDWARSHEQEFLDRNVGRWNPQKGWAGKWPKTEEWDYIAFHDGRLKALLIELDHEPDAILRQWRERGWLDVGNDKTRYKKQIRLRGNGRPGSEGEKVWMIAIRRAAVDEVESE